jgi:MFS transporter, NNP family, nitrate/nitrite transporter
MRIIAPRPWDGKAMQFKQFMKVGHPPTLFSAFLYFDMSFMVWVLLGPLGVFIARDLGLSPAQKGLMVAVPVLSGAFFRFFMGLMVDRIGAKLTGQVGQVIVMAGMAWAYFAHLQTLSQVYLMGILLGVAGASFAVALPLASRWYPPEAQGLAMGIAGAGNSGTAISALFGPLLAQHFGWNAVFGIALIPLVLTFITYSILAKDSPDAPPPKKIHQYLTVLKDSDTWWFMFFYCVTFGGFVGLSSSLVIYFNSQFGVNPVTAGYLTAACVFAGSLFRPIGGRVADQVGGIRSLQYMYACVAVAMTGVALASGSLVLSMACFIIGMMALGMGNGAVFQLIPQRFRKEIGVLTGLVGMAGGVGGFYLATSLGLSKQWTGDYRTGFFAFACLGTLAFIGLQGVKRRWRSTWGSPLVTAAKV